MAGNSACIMMINVSGVHNPVGSVVGCPPACMCDILGCVDVSRNVSFRSGSVRNACNGMLTDSAVGGL